MPKHAVLTGDIVNSTQLEPIVEKELVKELSKVLKPYQFEFYRGDSFQVYMKEPVKSFQVALLCRSVAVSMTGDMNDLSMSDVRISIGVGAVKTPVRTLATAKGEAFVLSGRSFDEMQAMGRRISIRTGNVLADIGLQVIADYTDAIYRGMTAKQAEAICGLLKGGTQQSMALQLEKSKSTISQLVSTGRWNEIERLLRQFESLIKQL
jgi:hypothetical protein